VYENNRAVPLGAVATFRTVQIIERAIDAYRAWRVARATKAALHDLTDQQLADIGLHRGEIDAVAHDLARG
jgi:uncharacterized protein YjiS (DUF1127 family)